MRDCRERFCERGTCGQLSADPAHPGQRGEVPAASIPILDRPKPQLILRSGDYHLQIEPNRPRTEALLEWRDKLPGHAANPTFRSRTRVSLSGMMPVAGVSLSSRRDTFRQEALAPTQRRKGASALASSSFGTATPPAVALAAQRRDSRVAPEIPASDAKRGALRIGSGVWVIVPIGPRNASGRPDTYSVRR
jgi:hypothetical protein